MCSVEESGGEGPGVAPRCRTRIPDRGAASLMGYASGARDSCTDGPALSPDMSLPPRAPTVFSLWREIGNDAAHHRLSSSSVDRTGKHCLFVQSASRASSVGGGALRDRSRGTP